MSTQVTQPGKEVTQNGNKIETKTLRIQPYSNKELAILYGMSERTFRTWLAPFKEELGKRIGWYWNVRQVKIIIKRLGLPCDAGTENDI